MPPRLLKQGVYVLQQKGGLFYVGKSTDIAKRIREHKAGRGTVACNLSTAKRVPPLTSPIRIGDEDDWESWERNETLTRMYEFGIQNVRGWMFTSRYLSMQDKENAFQQITERFDLCRNCGAKVRPITTICFRAFLLNLYYGDRVILPLLAPP
jgi:hypothetical protein